MGVYIYSVRTKSATVVLHGEEKTAYAINFLAKSYPDYDGWESECRSNRMLMAGAEATWERRGVKSLKGSLVFLCGKKDQPHDGVPAIEYHYDAPVCYDTDSFGRTLGFLRKARKGRRVVWVVEPTMWEVMYSMPNRSREVWNGDSRKVFFSAAEALAHAKKVPAGCKAMVEVLRAAPKTRHERVAAPDTDDPAVAKIKLVLLSGPWPASMWEKAGLASTADDLVADGRLLLYRDTDEAGGELNYMLGHWANMVDAAATHLGAPGAAVDYGYEGGKVVCTVATVGRFEARNAESVVYQMESAARKGRRFMLNLNVTLASDNPKLYAMVDGDKITFTGGKHGEHSLSLMASSDERILVHWAGYCENNGARAV